MMLNAGGDPKLQINNVCSLFTRHPETLQDLPPAEFAGHMRPCATTAPTCSSAGGQGSKYHCANELNLFFQVYGERNGTVHPRHSAQMDPLFTQPKGNPLSPACLGPRAAGVLIGPRAAAGRAMC
ncbi:MAG: hypothetical protein R3F17_17305 [Planctomycetota bacterium]